MKPNSIVINSIKYYLVSELYDYDRNFFIGCTKNRTIIDKFKLQNTDYLFAYQKNNEWITSTIRYSKAKLLLNEDWVNSHVPKFTGLCLYKYEPVPPVLILRDNEKFMKDDKIFDIEIRGVREYDKCFFRVKDISNLFNIPNLQITINSVYERNLHYKIFIDSTDTKINNVYDTASKKRMYLTYVGVLKVLFSSRTGNAEHFQQWAANKLFIIQMGTDNQRFSLAAELVGVTPKIIKDVFKLNSAKTPCVYLYLIGPASIINNTYASDYLLCKYGCTDDLDRRCQEHDRHFKKEFSTTIELLCFSIIEPKYIFDAETNIRQFFKSDTIEYKNSKELIIINKKDIDKIKQQYAMIQNSYISRHEELINRVNILEKDIIQLSNNILLKDKELELKDKEIRLLIANHANELKDKEIEFLTYKINHRSCIK